MRKFSIGLTGIVVVLLLFCWKSTHLDTYGITYSTYSYWYEDNKFSQRCVNCYDEKRAWSSADAATKLKDELYSQGIICVGDSVEIKKIEKLNGSD